MVNCIQHANDMWYKSEAIAELLAVQELLHANVTQTLTTNLTMILISTTYDYAHVQQRYM